MCPKPPCLFPLLPLSSSSKSWIVEYNEEHIEHVYSVYCVYCVYGVYSTVYTQYTVLNPTRRGVCVYVCVARESDGVGPCYMMNPSLKQCTRRRIKLLLLLLFPSFLISSNLLHFFVLFSCFFNRFMKKEKRHCKKILPPPFARPKYAVESTVVSTVSISMSYATHYYTTNKTRRSMLYAKFMLNKIVTSSLCHGLVFPSLVKGCSDLRCDDL